MSAIVEFFIAPGDDAAMAVAANGPDGIYETAQYGSFSPDIAMEEWERAFAIADGNGPRTVASNGSSFVFAVSASLQAALTAADAERLAEVAARWSGLRADDGEEIPPDFASDILSETASLARTATERGHRLYTWWG
jgi:hypothetical protein